MIQSVLCVLLLGMLLVTENYSGVHLCMLFLAVYIVYLIVSELLRVRKKTPITIVVDGIIGSGKTTLITEHLVPFFKGMGLEVCYIPEPVEKWKEEGLLQRFYSDMKGQAAYFQQAVLADRIINCIESIDPKVDVYITERSPLTDKIFAKTLVTDNNMTKLEYKQYKSWWGMWHRLYPLDPTLFIFYKPSISICMERVTKRNRSEESGITIEYQKKLLKFHEKTFKPTGVKVGNKNVPVLIISSDEDLSNDKFSHNVKMSVYNRLMA